MPRVFVTGSTDGLGLAVARSLLEQGHEVVGHARTDDRADDLIRALPSLSDVLVADLSSLPATRDLAHQANRSGRFDAVIHNAGVGYREPGRQPTVDGHARVLAINVLAPFVLTSLMTRPERLIYLSSGMHRHGDDSLVDLDWRDRPWQGAQACSDSKLFDAALSAALARRWPGVASNAVEPGWVPTKMGGPGAPDDLRLAPLTQVWLAVSQDPAAVVSGAYLYHQRPRETHPAVQSAHFQDGLVAALAELTAVALPD